MRVRVAKLITAFVIILNFIAVYFIWRLLSQHSKSKSDRNNNLSTNTHVTSKQDLNNFKRNIKLLHNDVTVIIRSFEQFDHDIVDTIKSTLHLYPNVTVLVVTDNFLYPPILLNSTASVLTANVKFINLKTSITNSFKNRSPILQIRSKYVLFIPDSTRFNSKKMFDKLTYVVNKAPGKVIAIPFKGHRDPIKCLSIHLDIREWFIRFDEMPNKKLCDFIRGKHALFVKFEDLTSISDPFMLPFPDSLYIQLTSQSLKVMISEEIQLNNGKELLKSHHKQWKAQQANKERQKNMFQSLELKKVVRENGVIDWYGCRRDTPRCFGTVIDETPQYLWEGKWTPPCCLAGLRRTARHVFEQLQEARVRYWLEGGSLLGAMRSGDILPWDYDVDIGIYQEDISKCTWLLRAGGKPVTDPQGFVWEKAIEGDFYRVQFSQVNRLHVDIFPFYSKNGTMTKDTWFKSHPQDREFPEHYLKPLSTIEFVGRTVSAPNNIHDFLELKFGEGAIENPEYPNPHKMVVHGLPRGPNNSR